MKQKRISCRTFVKSVNRDEGTVDKIVSVFDNVDYVKDRVKPGAFSNSLKRWAESGDPIPVIYSHQWENLDAHVGIVIEAKEIPAGDDILPDEIKNNGGLFVREKYDMDEPFAKRLFDLQDQRRIKESSFAYDVIEEKKQKDGVNDLIELEIIEVGPTLKGANPATQLLATKGFVEMKAGRVLSTKNEKKLRDASALLDEVLSSVEATDSDDSKAKSRKAWAPLEGSMEERQDLVRNAVQAWAYETYASDDERAYAYADGTYDDRVVFTVSVYGEESQTLRFEASYEIDDEGQVVLGEPTEVDLRVTVVSKSKKDAEKVIPINVLILNEEIEEVLATS